MTNKVPKALLNLTTATAGDNSTLPATTAFVQTAVTNALATYTTANFNNSLVANGYQKLPGGLILQWGVTGPVTTVSDSTITFPIAYTTAAYSVVATANSSGTTQASNLVNSFTKTNFVVHNSGSTSSLFSWIAIGY